MTTLASPSLGGASLAVWRVAMPPGGQGPLHAFDGEQVLTVTGGGLELELGEGRERLGTGDSAVLPARTLRRVTADPVEGLEALVVARAGVRASMPDGTDRGVPPWIA
jgi:quercetin dioxygenase-like cupin family protein